MAADEMFEKLGYYRASNDYYDNDKNIRISFENDTQEVIISHLYYYDGVSYEYNINFQELKAINKKVKELGWME